MAEMHCISCLYDAPTHHAVVCSFRLPVLAFCGRAEFVSLCRGVGHPFSIVPPSIVVTDHHISGTASAVRLMCVCVCCKMNFKRKRL